MNTTKQDLLKALNNLLDKLRQADKADTPIELSLSLAYFAGMQDLITYIDESEVIS